MHLFKRLFQSRQSEISPDALTRNIHEFSRMLKPELWTRRMGMIETIQAADSQGMEILPNLEVDRIIRSGGWDRNIGFVWTGTLIIFEEAGIPFRERIESAVGMVEARSINLDTFAWHRGLEGGCLAVHHPHFRLHRSGENRFELNVPHEALHYLKDFPVREGRFPVERFFGLPVDKAGGDVYMILRPRSHIGLVARSMLDPKMLFTSDLPSEEMAAFVRPAINPMNYVNVVARIVRNGAGRGAIEFAHHWAKEDPDLAKRLR